MTDDLHKLAPGLVLDGRGLWSAPRTAAVSYPDDAHALCHELEDGSFWFAHRNACLVAALRRRPPGGTLFDVGGGNGFVARALADAGFEVVVVEPGLVGALNARARGLAVVHATLDEAGFVPGSLPAIGLFDTVEHVADEDGFLGIAARALAPGGRLYVTVPAYGWLWSRHDDEAGHFRRYSAATLHAALARAGLDVEQVAPFFSPLVVPSFLLRALPYRLGFGRARPMTADGHRHAHRSLAARALGPVLGWEVQRIAADRPIPVGASLLGVARKT